MALNLSTLGLGRCADLDGCTVAIHHPSKKDWRLVMKKFLISTAVALGMASPALAADMAVKSSPAPLPQPIYNWTGFYIGANGGWGQSRNCWGFVPVGGAIIPDGCSTRSGGLVCGQLGYRC